MVSPNSSFVLAKIYPRSIAWVVRVYEDNAWEQLERVIACNCSILGGMHSLLVPLNAEGEINDEYRELLRDFDPDLIVLPPECEESPVGLPSEPYGVLTWEAAKVFIGFRPGGFLTEQNCRVPRTKRESESLRGLIAVGADEHPNTSKLALVACGDVESGKLILERTDGEVSLSSIGYREFFLFQFVGDGRDINHVSASLIESYNGANRVQPAPNRKELSELIDPDYQFPLTGAKELLEACCLTSQPHYVTTFLRSTVPYDGQGHGNRFRRKDRPFSDELSPFVILVSDEFGPEEAVDYWNARANGISCAWVSFEMLSSELEEIAAWLASDLGGLHYAGWDYRFAFAARSGEEGKLTPILEQLRIRLRGSAVFCQSKTRKELVTYDRLRPEIGLAHVVVTEGQSRAFLPPVPEGYGGGAYVVELDWPGVAILPRSTSAFRSTVCRSISVKFPGSPKPDPILSTPGIRLTRDRSLRFQVTHNRPLHFSVPSMHSILLDAFSTSGATSLEVSSTARYHLDFVTRAGDLLEAARILKEPNLQQLWMLLADSNKGKKPGWVLTLGRRALHHRDLNEVVGNKVSDQIEKYFQKDGDLLPEYVEKLLAKQMLERGYRLTCRFCSHSDWYAAQQVGQEFTCHRCLSNQAVLGNPFWLYKLPEVTYQGFADHMEVPLLALAHLQQRTARHFDWIPDSNLVWFDEIGEHKSNIDILCLRDGRLFVGEAKSNGEIETGQFRFYEHLCREFGVDGVVFATSEEDWNKGTNARIDALAEWFPGEVIVLRKEDLYDFEK